MKTFLCKIYRSDRTYIKNWSDATFDGFRMQKNGGLGQCQFKLARKFDDFGENDDVKLGNWVDVWVHDDDTPPEGLLLYSGFISNYEPDSNDTGVVVNTLGSVTTLAMTLLRTDVYVNLGTYNAEHMVAMNDTVDIYPWDSSDIITDIIYYYRLNSVNPVINVGDIDLTGSEISYLFKMMTHLDAIEKCRELAPADWYWFVGADNLLNYKAKPTSATHSFIFGKHFTIDGIKVSKNMENVRNRILLTTGDGDQQISKIYSDTASSILYGDRWEVLTDSNILSVTEADAAGASALAEKKDVEIKIVLEIADATYDIESIKPGDTCQILNLNSITAQTFTNNMSIESVDYTPEKVTLEIGSLSDSVSRQAIINKKAIASKAMQGAGGSYE